MADQPVTIEKLVNADKDVQVIEDFIKKPKDETVTTRFGDEIMTLKGLVEYIKQSGGYFNKYNTLAEANADIANIPTDRLVRVVGELDGGDYYKETDESEELTKSPYDPASVALAAVLEEINKYFSRISERTGWALPFIDSIDQILGGFDANGKFNAEGIEVVTVLKDTISRLSSLEGVIVSTSNPSRTGVIFSVQDNEDQLLMHLTTDMQLYVAGMPVGVNQSIIDDIDDLKDNVLVISDNLNSLNTLVAVGDSTTEGAGSTGGNTYPYYAAQTLGRSVSNQGIGGQDAIRISARLNGASVLATFADNTIPADTTAKAVTLNIPLLTTPATTAARTRKVWIAGVYGTLAKDTSNNYTFARDVAGSVVNVAPNSHVLIDTGDLQNRIALIWMGTNNSFATESDRQAVIDNIDLVIKSLKPINKRYLVLSPWKSNTNIKGSDIHNQMLEMHKMLASKYKERFVNVWWDLVCSYDPNIPQDVIDFNNMVVPSSKMSDSTHPNSLGYQVIGSQSIPNKINQLGW